MPHHCYNPNQANPGPSCSPFLPGSNLIRWDDFWSYRTQTNEMTASTTECHPSRILSGPFDLLKFQSEGQMHAVHPCKALSAFWGHQRCINPLFIDEGSRVPATNRGSMWSLILTGDFIEIQVLSHECDAKASCTGCIPLCRATLGKRKSFEIVHTIRERLQNSLSIELQREMGTRHSRRIPRR